MSKFILSMGLVISALAGSSGAVLGATPAARVVEARDAMVVLAAQVVAPVDGPFNSLEDAKRDAVKRQAQGYRTEIKDFEVRSFCGTRATYWEVHCSMLPAKADKK